MASVTLHHVQKSYQDQAHHREVPAVRDVSIHCEDGEFMVFLGPSGCGKTSTLRMIAGLETIDAGTIHIGDRCVNRLPPRDRSIGMAFENYALYPPLNVRENLLFPLKARGFPKEEMEPRLKWVTGILHMEDILDRRPGELSGGQQQRVSLGRCLIRDADVYLLDEPLSHLDADLRLRTRGELKRIHALSRRTMIYVTHDQMEAMSLADRIAVMNEGTLQQVGTPREVFENPANLFVADFVGEPPINLIEGTLAADGNSLTFLVQPSGLQIPLSPRWNALAGSRSGQELVAGIRPHHLLLGKREGWPAFPGRLNVYESLGEAGVLEADISGTPLVVLTEPDLPLESGESIMISMDHSSILLFDKSSGQSIRISG